MRNALRMPGLHFTCVFCVSVACFKDSSWHNFKQFFQMTTILSWGQLYVRYKLALWVRSTIFTYYCLKRSKVHQLIDMVATHDFYPMGPTIWMPIIAFSRVVVKWNVIFIYILFFLMKILKFQKMSDWNELSSISGKWKFCRIYWQWILIEQIFLYTVVYRTFLYNPTKLKVPKKAPCVLPL